MSFPLRSWSARSWLILSGGLFVAGCGAPMAVGIEEAPSLPVRVVDAQANAFTSSTQENVTVDFDGGGNVLVAWDSRRQQNGQYGVYARRLNAQGEAISPEVQVNAFEQGYQGDPCIAAAPDGTSWIAWMSLGQDGEAGTIIARRFDRLLRPISKEVIVNTTAAGHQSDPAVAVAPDGSCLIAWTRTDRDSGVSRIALRSFDALGSPRGVERLIPTRDGVTDTMPAVVAVDEPTFAVAFGRRRVATGAMEIVAALIDPSASRVITIMQVSPSDGTHVEPSIDRDSSGGVRVAWLASEGGAHRVATRQVNLRTREETPVTIITGDDAGWVSGVAVACGPRGEALITYSQFIGSAQAADAPRLNVMGQFITPDDTMRGEPFIVTRTSKGDQVQQIASNVRRSRWNDAGQIVVGWNGDAGLGDPSAANVTLWVPQHVIIEAPSAVALAGDATRIATEMPIPPVFDPNWKRLPPPVLPLNPGPDFGFLGIDFTGWTPPDPELAAGPNHLVAMTNGAIAFFDHGGNLLFQDEIEDSFGFWGAQGATGFVFDPECLYDIHSGRFFAMSCERASNGLSYYLLAVSDDSNPMGTWHKYRIHTPVDNDIDSPNMSVDQNVVYLTADFFGPDKFGVLMIEKAPILGGGAINSRSLTITGAGDQSMGVPINYDANSPVGFLIQSSEGTGNGVSFSEVRIHGIRNQLTNPTRVTVDVTVPTYSYPNQPPQAGTGNRPFLFEPRFWSCMHVNGSLWAVHHVNENRARVRWYEFQLNGWPDSGQNPTLRQSGELDYGGQIHTYFPSIAADEAGNATIVFARSSPTEFISMSRAFRKAGDALGTFRPMVFVKESTSPYTGANRWGDYSHVEPEPDDLGAFWGIHEWTDTSNGWRTWIAEIDTAMGTTGLTGFSIVTGTLLAGGLPEMQASDNSRLRARSGFGQTFTDLHKMDMIVNAVTDVDSPATIDLSIESHVDQPSGTATISLRNWDTNQFVPVGSYALTSSDAVRTFNDIAAGSFVSDAGQVDILIRHVVFVPQFAFQFESRIDHVQVTVE